MAQTIYVVTSGEYSAYHIDAVFTDKDKAYEFADQNPKRSVELYEANKAEFKDKQWYVVRISMTGDNDDVTVSLGGYYADVVIGRIGYWSEVLNILEYSVLAENATKAKAIALERHHALLPVIDTHYPLLNVPDYNKDSSFMYGYFDHVVYVRKEASVYRLMMNISQHAPIPWHSSLTDDFTEARKEARKHGIQIEYRTSDMKYHHVYV